jgi:hypothetical protein
MKSMEILPVVAQKEEKSSDQELYNKRVHTYFDTRFIMEHGLLEEGHPAYEYAHTIVEKLYGKEEEGKPIRIIPDWRSVNAFVDDRDIVYLYSRIFEFAEYEESLAGVIAHEKVHARQKHIEKKKLKRKEEVNTPFNINDLIRTELKKIGTNRMNEYEADMRAALQDLEKAGINPLGMKILLQKYAQQEARSNYNQFSNTHGRSIDRALNIATGSYLMDLKSLSNDLHKIPEELIESLKKETRPASSAIFSRPKNYPGLIKSYDERVRERREAIDSIVSPDELIIAVNAIYHYRLDNGEKEYDKDDDICLKSLLEKIIAHITKETGIEDRMSLLVLSSYFSGVKPQLVDSLISTSEKERKPITMSGFIGGISNAVNKQIFPFACSHDSDFGRNLGDMLISKKLLRKSDHHFIDAISDNLQKIVAEYSMYESSTEKVKKGFEVVFVDDELGEEDLADGVDEGEKGKESGFWKKDDLNRFDPLVSEILKRNIIDKRIVNLYKSVPLIIKDLEQHVVGKPIQELFKFVSQIYLALHEVFYNDAENSSTMREVYLDVLIPYIARQVMNKGLDAKVSAGDLSMKDAEIYRIVCEFQLGRDDIESVARGIIDLHHGMRNRSYSRSHFSQGYSEDEEASLDDIIEEMKNEEEAAQEAIQSLTNNSVLKENDIWILKEIADSIANEKVLVFPKPRSQSSIVKTYQLLVDEKYRNENNLDITFSRDALSRWGVVFFSEIFEGFIKNKDLASALSIIKSIDSEIDGFQGVLIEERKRFPSLFEKIIASYEDESIWDFSLEDIFTLSNFIDNPFLNQSFKSIALEKKWEGLSFEEKKNFLFPRKGKNGVVDFSLREKFMLEDVTTKERYEEVKEVVATSIDEMFSNVSVGKAVLADRLTFKYFKPLEFLIAALKTSESPQLLTEWIGDNIAVLETRDDDLPNPNTDDGEKDEDTVKRKRVAIDELANRMFSMDDLSRRLVVRKVLVGEGGMLTTQEGRKSFFDTIFKEWLESSGDEKDLESILDNIKEELISEENYELLYFAIQGLLADKIFIPPSLDKKESIEKMVGYEKVYKLEQQLRKLIKLKDRPDLRKQKVGPIEFIKEVAGNMGALGRRFLQVLPQFIEISDKYAEEFSDVYDKVAGQSKFAALATIDREWPEIWNEFSEINGRVGGGSMVTVFDALNKNGETEVLKVRNPNILYHLEEAQKVVGSITERLAKKHGGGYVQAREILPDISKWINNDVTFEGFLVKDKAFREKYNNFSVPGNPYKIIIPESFGPQNPYFAREKYMPGTNLTSFDQMMSSGEYDMKKIVGLLSKFYVQQIMDGRLHSDVHQGNYSVSKNNEVIMYDRNYYLDLTDPEKEAILSLFNPFANVDSKAQKIKIILGAKDETLPAITDFVKALSTGKVDEAKKHLIEIKSQGAKVPLNFTLLLKNIASLNMFAKKAGFSNVIGAVM